MKVYRPVPPPGVADAAATASFAGELHRIGIIDDNLDPVLMDGLLAGIEDAVPGASVTRQVKPVGTAPAPESMVADLAAAHQVAVTGIGM